MPRPLCFLLCASAAALIFGSEPSAFLAAQAQVADVAGDRRVRTLLYEAANVMLTRYQGQLKLKDWAFAIAKRSTMRKARVALARRLAIIMHAMLRDGTEFASA